MGWLYSLLPRIERFVIRLYVFTRTMCGGNETDELCTAQVMVLSDRPPEPVDVLWFFGRARGDTDRLFELVAGELRLGGADHVVINGSDGERQGGKKPGEAWEGKRVWTMRLNQAGVESVRYCKPAGNTKDEGEAMLAYSLTQGWKSAAIVCQPHQPVRAMLGLVKSMADRGEWMRVYAIVPGSTDWFRLVFGSQGHDELPRYLHIQQELIRIRLYQTRGDLCSFADLLEYYRNRASIR